MVWLHGGGFTIGAGGFRPITAKRWPARRGCGDDQLPSRSSRLFRPSGAGREEDRVVHNFALLDQIAALKWVQDNIAAFGGDPQRDPVWRIRRRAQRAVAAGLSAGSGLSIRRLCKAATPYRTRRAQALQKGEALAAHFGLENASAEQLRAIPPEAFWPLTRR
jgi:para-nitrobenzyl esterase